MGVSCKGQSSIEFTMALVIYLSILIALFALYMNISDSLLTRNKYLKSKNTADMLASRINNLAVHAKRHDSTVYAHLDRSDYNISVNENSIVVGLGGVQAYSHIVLPQSNVNLDFNSTYLKIYIHRGIVHVVNAEQ